MEKLEPIQPGKTYRIVQQGNGDEPLFFEPTNKIFFQKLIEKHLVAVCIVLDFELKQYRIELTLKFRAEDEIPEKYKGKLYQPISNLFNSYTKSMNKRYNREGSLFRTRFERLEV